MKLLNLAIIILLLNLPCLIVTLSLNQWTQISRFCAHKGQTKITFLFQQQQQHQRQIKKSQLNIIHQIFNHYLLQVNFRFTSESEFAESYELFETSTDFLIIKFEDNADYAINNSLIKYISKRLIQKTLLVLDSNQSLETVSSKLEKGLDSVGTYLYTCAADSNILIWNSIIKIQTSSRVIINSIQFDDGANSPIIETFDLQGLEIKDLNNDWAPYLTLKDCDEISGLCQTVNGIFHDISKVFQKMFNFTMLHYKQPDGMWGTTTQNGTLMGLFGNMASGKFESSLNGYSFLKSRGDYFDYASFSQRHTVLVFIQQPPPIDFGLFIRPFTIESWIVSIIMISMLSVISLIPLRYLKHSEQSQSLQIMSTTGWTCYFLLFSFYGGALTMYFINEPSIPFNNLRGAMQSYPDWNLMMQKGMQGIYIPLVQEGDPDYVSFYQRVLENQESTVYHSVKEGFWIRFIILGQ